MSEKLPATFRSLILTLICIFITRSNSVAHSTNCSDYLNPFTCRITKKQCTIKTSDGRELDCKQAHWKIEDSATFTYNITIKNGEEKVCDGCCCHPLSADLKSYPNYCLNCVQLWSISQQNGTNITFSGNKSVMEEALQSDRFSEIRVEGAFPPSVEIFPIGKKTRCRLKNSTNLNNTWTIVASNKKWRDYFEESIINGFIRVKNSNIPVNIHLAIQRKLLNETLIHFLNIRVMKGKTANSPCLKPEEENLTPLSLMTAPPVTTKVVTASSTRMVHSSSFGTSKTSAVPEERISSSLPFINPSTTPSSSSSNSVYGYQDKTLTPKDIYIQTNLKKELNLTANQSERIGVVAKFVGRYNHLNEDNLAAAVRELKKVKENQVSENITKDFTEVVDHVASTNNVKSWKNLPQKTVQPSSIMSATDSYFEGATRHMKVADKAREIRKQNLILHYGRVSKKRAYILNSYKVSFSATVNIPQQIIQTTRSEIIRYSFVYYKSLSILMKTVATSWKEKESQSERLNSPILSISLYPQLRYPLKENINFTLNHIRKSNSRHACAYWNFSYQSRRTGIYGRWETKGCNVVSKNQTCTTCSCNHLTNFALLMSVHPTIVNNNLTTLLSFFSGIVSILMVFLTITCYVILWPNITQNPVNRSRAIILMNLCVALIIANIIFLAGTRPIANKMLCKAVSVSLHFFYLAVFFSMLMEGLDMLITVILVFSKKIKAKWVILGIWSFPLLIVGISLPIKFDNYADEDHCWLSVNDGLRWAFVGPALFVIFVNAIILIIVISRMLRTQEMMQKTVRERLRCGARGIVLLSPILGFTWITGIFLIHTNPVMQYIFIACHALQGIFIFLLHCILSRQVKEGFRQWLQKKSYFNEFSNSTLKCAVLDQTNGTRTMSTAQSLDDLDSYQTKLSDFQPRKSCDYLIPGK